MTLSTILINALDTIRGQYEEAREGMQERMHNAEHNGYGWERFHRREEENSKLARLVEHFSGRFYRPEPPRPVYTGGGLGGFRKKA